MTDQAATHEHGRVVASIAQALTAYVREHKLGYIVIGGGFRLKEDPEQVRAPDVAFVSKKRYGNDLPNGVAPFAPDVAIEVISPTDKFDEVLAAVQSYFDAGTRRVWLVRPRVHMVTVHRSVHDVEVLGESELLRSDDSGITGLELPIASLF